MGKPRPITDAELRSAKLSRIPGVTIAESAARFSVTAARVSAARKRYPEETRITLAELALAALTHNGLDSSCSLADLASVAEWLDYVNHDASTIEDVRLLLNELAEQGLLELRGETALLLKPWP